MFTNTKIGLLAERMAYSSQEEIWLYAVDDQSILTQMHDLNNQQLDEGLYSDDTETGEYAPMTIQIKRSLGQTWQHMTFFDTGYTRSTIRFRATSDGLDVDMDDRYDLLRHYGDHILGLNSNSIEFIKDEIIKNIQEYILEG